MSRKVDDIVSSQLTVNVYDSVVQPAARQSPSYIGSKQFFKLKVLLFYFYHCHYFCILLAAHHVCCIIQISQRVTKGWTTLLYGVVLHKAPHTLRP
jgi:hypothetical protein